MNVVTQKNTNHEKKELRNSTLKSKIPFTKTQYKKSEKTIYSQYIQLPNGSDPEFIKNS